MGNIGTASLSKPVTAHGIFNNISKGTKSVGGSEKNNSTPPIGSDTIPEYIRKSIYFVTYMGYVYKFSMYKSSNIVSKAGYQSKVLKRITELSNGKVTFGDNSWTKWGLRPEYDFVEGTYVPYRLPFKYMGQKNEDLLFMMKFIAESINYSAFADMFGGSGVCSLARANNSSIKEYINDFNYDNICFYLAMTEHFKEFKAACKELDNRIRTGNLPQEFYIVGDKIWHQAVDRLCEKLNKLLKNMERSYNNTFLPEEQRVSGIDSEPAGRVMVWNKMGEDLIEPYDWNVVATPQNIVDLTCSLADYITQGRYSDYQLAFNVFAKECRKIINTLEIKEVYSEKEKQDTIKYAIGVYKHFEALKLEKSFVQLSMTPNIPFNMERAVGFVYTKMFMRVQPSVSWVNLKNLSKFVMDGVRQVFLKETCLYI